MTLRISFVGPVAAGLAEDKEPTAADLLDLFDERIYRTRWPDDPYELQFAGIAALIACCGAWPEEIARLETTDISVKNVPPGAQAVAGETVDNGIWLGLGKCRRRVWVPDAARMTLTRVTGRIAPAEGCTRLFMRGDGTAMSGQEIIRTFSGLTRRTGCGGNGLHTRLRAFFHEWVSICGDDLAEAFLSRRVPAMRRARGPFGEGEPTMAKLRKAFERSSHPLRELTHAMLRHAKPIDRSYPSRAFRTLSPEAMADVAAIKTAPFVHCYPPELVEAVFAATEGGRHEREIAAHYGIPQRTVDHLLRHPNKLDLSPRRRGMGPRMHQKTFLTHARRHPGKTASQIASWLGERGIRTRKQNLIMIARREGVRLAHPRGALRNGRDPKRVEAHIRKHPEHTVLDVQAWAREALGREIPAQALYHFADQRGLRFASCFKLAGVNAAALEAFVRANGDANIYKVMAWIEGELRLTVAKGTVRAFLWRRGLKTRKLPTGKAAPYETEMLAWIKANPDAEFAEARAWLKAELGMTVNASTLHSFLDTHGIKLRPSKGGTRAPYGPALLAWLGSHPEADLDGAMAWLENDPDFKTSRVTVRVFLARNGINLRGNKPA